MTPIGSTPFLYRRLSRWRRRPLIISAPLPPPPAGLPQRPPRRSPDPSSPAGRPARARPALYLRPAPRRRATSVRGPRADAGLGVSARLTPPAGGEPPPRKSVLNFNYETNRRGTRVRGGDRGEGGGGTEGGRERPARAGRALVHHGARPGRSMRAPPARAAPPPHTRASGTRGRAGRGRRQTVGQLCPNVDRLWPKRQSAGSTQGKNCFC